MKKSFKRAVSVLCAAAVLTFGSVSTVSATFSSSYLDSGDITVTINTNEGRRPISPYIYGINSDASLSGVKVNALKQSGEQISSYNWETNFSNNGAKNGAENGNSLIAAYPQDIRSTPGLYTDNLVSKAKRYNIPSRYVTLQMMGFVANDASGAITEFDSDSRWAKVYPHKNDSYLSRPDISDGAVYMDEYVSYIVNKYGYAVDGGINGYFLDNEPESWSKLYPSAVPKPVTAKELAERSAELAKTVKKIDPTALVYGPSLNGIEAYINLGNSDDRNSYSKDYSWFIDYYLMSMSAASEQAGTRLLDVLDLHYHTEATNGLLQPIIDSTDAFSNNTRLQATRILWDSTYTENSTVAIMHNQHIPLLPTLEASIGMYYPGTKLSFSEYNFGGGEHISGGISTADALGIFATYGVHMACLKPNTKNFDYQKSAINLYTNYDGEGSGFGNTIVSADNGGDIMSSVYASVDQEDATALKAVLINKNQHKNKNAEVTINSDVNFESAEIYSFNEVSAEIVHSGSVLDIENNTFTLDMEPLTVYMLVFSGNDSGSVIDDSPIIDEPDDTSVTDGTTVSETELPDGGDTQSDTAVTTSVSETSVQKPSETTATSVLPEHVEAETFSSAGTSESPVTEQASDDDPDASSDPSGDNETEEKAVPKAVKVIVCSLVAAVILAMGYVIVSDVLQKNKRAK